MPLALTNSALGPSRSVGGSPAPSFTNREVTNIRLRDGESHLLAGLLQDDERKTMRGFPGVMSVKIKDSFSEHGQRYPADRHRDAVDAAHHPRTNTPTTIWGRLTLRHQPELRADRSAAAHRGHSRGAERSARRRGFSAGDSGAGCSAATDSVSRSTPSRSSSGEPARTAKRRPYSQPFTAESVHNRQKEQPRCPISKARRPTTT